MDQLPNHNDVLDLLKAEQAPLDIWLAFAREYFKQGKIESFLEVLQEGSGPEVDEFYGDVKYERIAILNALGAYYTNLGKTNKRQRDEYFIKAVDFYNKAARIDSQELTTWVGKGQLQLAKGDWEQSAEMFKIVLQEHPDHVPALLGQACVFFNKGKVQDALANYKKVLEVHPRCTAAVRLGIGLCHYRLRSTLPGRADFHNAKARQSFERVLQLEPDNVEGLVALAMLDINSDDVTVVRRALERMRRAFEIYPYNAMALNHLSNHYFFTGQHQLVEALTEAALTCTNHSNTRAESYYHLARSCHSKGDYDKASFYYRHAAQELPAGSDFTLPYYGLGQIHFYRGELEKALAALDKVLAAQPSNAEALKVVGSIQARQGRLADALTTFKKVTSLHSSDTQAWIETSELQVANDFGGALQSLQRAQSLFIQQRRKVPFELLNDIAVLHFLRHDYLATMSVLKEALGSGPWTVFSEGPGPDAAAANFGPIESKAVRNGYHEEESKEVKEFPAEKVAVVYNLARLHEQLYETNRAIALYRLILQKHPTYVDCYLRLAIIAQARCNWVSSSSLIETALAVSPSNIDALLLQSLAEEKHDDMNSAKDFIKKSMEGSSGTPPTPALLAMGNWNLAMSTRPWKDSKAEALYLDKARECFHKALMKNASNMYAANGAGCVFGEKGLLDMSKDIFNQVQEAIAGTGLLDAPDVWTNLAHIHLAKSETTLAIKMYQNCQRRYHYGTDAQGLLYLARAQYEAEQYKESQRTLIRAVHIAPTNYTLHFDAANVMQKHASVTLKKEKRSAEQVRHAVAELMTAVRMFEQLSVLGTQPSHGFDQTKSKLHLEYCKELLVAAKAHLEAAEREEQQNRQRQEVARQQALASEARRRAEEERKVQEERLKREEEEKKAAAVELEFQRRKASWKKTVAPEEDVDGGETPHRSKKEKKKRRKKNLEEAHPTGYEDEFMESQGYERGPDSDNEREEHLERAQGGSLRKHSKHREDMEAHADLMDNNVDAREGPTGSTKKKKRGRAAESDDDEEDGVAAREREEAEGGNPMEEDQNAGEEEEVGGKGGLFQVGPGVVANEALKDTGLEGNDSD